MAGVVEAVETTLEKAGLRESGDVRRRCASWT